MAPMMVTTSQLGMIHMLAKAAGFDDDVYRAFLEREASVSSAKKLSMTQAIRVIDKLKAAAGQGARPAGSVAGLDGPVARKLRALWIAAWNLGLLRDRSDRALLSFLERQTGVSHTRFLSEPRQGTKAIEGLKKWLAREAGVAWPNEGDALASKRAVIEAQWQRLVGLKAVLPGPLDDVAFKVASRAWSEFQPEHYDALQASLGRQLRAALATVPADERAEVLP